MPTPGPILFYWLKGKASSNWRWRTGENRAPSGEWGRFSAKYSYSPKSYRLWEKECVHSFYVTCSLSVASWNRGLFKQLVWNLLEKHTVCYGFGMRNNSETFQTRDDVSESIKQPFHSNLVFFAVLIWCQSSPLEKMNCLIKWETKRGPGFGGYRSGCKESWVSPCLSSTHVAFSSTPLVSCPTENPLIQ